jgi:hypothetical protein
MASVNQSQYKRQIAYVNTILRYRRMSEIARNLAPKDFDDNGNLIDWQKDEDLYATFMLRVHEAWEKEGLI